MRAFRFSLQAVLNLHEQQERQAELVLNQSIAKLREAEENHKQYRRHCMEVQSAIARLASEGIEGGQLARYSRRLQYLQERRRQWRTSVETAQGVVRKHQEEWREARRRRMVVERLREREYQRYLEGCRRAEERRISEIALRNWTWEGRGGVGKAGLQPRGR